jgi:uncharacterized protein
METSASLRGMNSAFVDTSFWICLRDRREPRHKLAREMAARLLHQRTTLVVTLLVFAETHAYFCRAPRLREQILSEFWENPVVRIENVSFQDQETALTILREHPDKDFSLCDAVSFAVMLRLQIRRTVAFDHHFRQFGKFEVIDH